MIILKPDKGPPMRQSASFRADLALHPTAIVSRPPPMPDTLTGKSTIDYWRTRSYLLRRYPKTISNKGADDNE